MAASRVRVESGTSYETLLALASIADPSMSRVFNAAPGLVRRVRAAAPGLIDDVRRLGRLGWVNLLSIAATGRRARTTPVLIEALRTLPPPELHRAVLGGRRRQLVELVGPELLDDAVRGDAAARRELRRVLASGATVLDATGWVLRSDSEAVRSLAVRVLRTWAEEVEDAVTEATNRLALRGEARRLRSEVTSMAPIEAIRSVAPGLDYRSERMPRELLLIPSPAVAPIVVFVDDVRRTILAAPPPAAECAEDPLLAGARALADPIRLRILDVLSGGPLVAADLARTVGYPRTTLLHHLALLRAAGLVRTAVGPTERTEYRINPDALRALGRAVGERFPAG